MYPFYHNLFQKKIILWIKNLITRKYLFLADPYGSGKVLSPRDRVYRRISKYFSHQHAITSTITVAILHHTTETWVRAVNFQRSSHTAPGHIDGTASTKVMWTRPHSFHGIPYLLPSHCIPFIVYVVSWVMAPAHYHHYTTTLRHFQGHASLHS